MTHYEEIKDYIKSHGYCTRWMIRHDLPHITHEPQLLQRLIDSGDGYRERVTGSDKRGTWGYFLNENK